LDFFVYSRDAPGTAALRDDEELLEEHWSYMDGFAESMIARGPTFGTDRETATGSLHVVGLPSVDAVREFVAHEPNNRAGVYAEHSVWRFENLLGRTMWEFAGAADEPKFLIIARSDCGLKTGTSPKPVPPESLTAELRARLILYGPLTELDDGGRWIVCELSSFQLEDIHQFRPRIAVLLNLEPDHLDRHGTFEAYREAKMRIFANQTATDCAVLNADDPRVADSGDSAAHPPAERVQDLHVCVECDSELVYPVQWEEAGPENWSVLVHCPNCDVFREGVFTQENVELFDEELDRGADAMARDYKRLMRANMADEIERFAGALEPLRQRAIAFLQEGMDAGEIRKQDPALLLFMLYTAVVGSLTEASVLNAVVGEDKGRQSLRMREREVQAFVIGVILLMFGVGLHFSIGDLLAAQGVVASGTFFEVNGTLTGRRDGLRARVAREQLQVLLAQRQQARRLAADDRHAALGVRRPELALSEAADGENALSLYRAADAKYRLW
jgi:uncharacterized protein YciI